jgi:tetratricopeptide (TPR) repeat protein
MQTTRFILAETLLILGLAFLGLVAAKATGGLQARGPAKDSEWRLAWVRGVLYTIIFALVVLGARGLAEGMAAGIHSMASEDDSNRLRVDRAYSNALRAVELRPGVLNYWKDLSVAKFRQGQFESVLKDEPVFRALNGGKLDEEIMMRLAYCHYFLGEYDRVILLTEEVIRNNRNFAAAYVLEAMTYTAQKNFARAEQIYLAVLQVFPSQEAAVEGLAHVHYLKGFPGTAEKVLDETAKFPFPPEARKRFDALKAYYAQ